MESPASKLVTGVPGANLKQCSADGISGTSTPAHLASGGFTVESYFALIKRGTKGIQVVTLSCGGCAVPSGSGGQL